MSVSWAIEIHDILQSTQDVLRGSADFGDPEGKVVQAREQTRGRGRHGREWVSQKGNLYLSILLRPSCHARHIGQLSILIAVALADTIRAHLKNPSVLMLKWPNDVLINDEKCAGILIETSLSDSGAILYAAVGVGMNIGSSPPRLGTCLNDHALKPVPVDQFRDVFLNNLARLYTAWNREGFAGIKARWLAMAHPKGTNLRVKIGPQLETGLFYGIDDDGNLLLHDRDLRQKKVTAGEVYLIN